MKQVDAVVAKMKERNPDFDRELTWKGERGVVTELSFSSLHVADLSPLGALPGLQIVHCQGGQVKDLSPLRSLKLTHLNCSNSQVADLSPLREMPLTSFWCVNTKVSDLSPLKDLPIKEIKLNLKAERDAAILRGTKTLEKINDKPVAEFWKEVDAKKAE